MEIIFFLVPIGVVMLAIAIGMFSWAVKSDQFEDLDREGRRILFDEDMVETRKAASPLSADTNSLDTEPSSSVEAPKNLSDPGPSVSTPDASTPDTSTHESSASDSESGSDGS